MVKCVQCCREFKPCGETEGLCVACYRTKYVDRRCKLCRGLLGLEEVEVCDACIEREQGEMQDMIEEGADHSEPFGEDDHERMCDGSWDK